MTIQEFKEIARHAAHRTAPANFTKDSVEKAFIDGLNELAGSVNQFMKNRYDIYDIVIENADEILPNNVIAAIGAFADVKTVAQGQKALYKKPISKARAKQFLTQVGVSGVYETFRLDSSTFELSAHAVGGGATVDFERMLDGAESLAEVMEVITTGLVDAVFVEVQRALRAALTAQDRPAANKVISNTFEADKMVKLMTVVRAYGSNVVIFAPPEFIAAMGPDAIVPVGTYGTSYPAVGVYPADDIESIHNTGYIKIFRGAPVVEMAQSFVDETNTETYVDPQMAYILPAGKEKVVKVVLEGQTQIKDFTNRDNSLEVYAWKKMGCAILCNYNWGIYQNTGITQTFKNPYENL